MHRPGGKVRRDGGVFNRLGSKGKSVSAHSKSRYQSYRLRRTEPVLKKRYHEGTSSRGTETFLESEASGVGNWNSRSKKQKLSIEDDVLSHHW
nr:hypothetical protein [Tanacetum cinerariifolium]